MPKVLNTAEAMAALRPDVSWHEIGERFGVSGEKARSKVRRWRASQRGNTLEAKVEAEDFIGIEADENNPRIASILAKGEVNLDEFYVHEARVNEWGHNPATGQPYYQARAHVRPIPGADLLKRLRDSVIEELAERWKINTLDRLAIESEKRSLPTDEFPFLLEISTYDLHIGKTVWAEQCVEGEYNSNIAIQRAQAATEKFLDRARQVGGIGQILLPIGNDLLHFDDLRQQTTRGTQMFGDLVYEQVYRLAVRFLRWQIEACAELAPTRVIIVRGNHDYQSVFHLGELLAAAYRDDSGVEIDNRVTDYKFARWGQTLLGYTHGHQPKRAHLSLPTIMADLAPKDWGETRFHEWRLGHRHNKFEWTVQSHDQNRTCGVHMLPSLCGVDKWHIDNGYRHHPRAEAHLFHLEEGHDTQFTYTAPVVNGPGEYSSH